MKTSLIACGSIDVGPGGIAIILSVMAIWIVCILCALVNLFWIFLIRPAPTKDFRLLQICFSTGYGFLAFLLFSGWIEDASFAMIAGLGIPILVFCQFTYLFIVRRKLGKSPSVELPQKRLK
ncbi:MAG: hypothetical protein WDM80_00450 [Limisphaerales bacterium]